MGGGKEAINVFNLHLSSDPREVFNWRLWFAVGTFGLMGAARGVDEGLISAVFGTKSFRALLDIDNLDAEALANLKGNVIAIFAVGSMVGAMIASLVCDRVGRVWATRQLCVTWILGIVIFLVNNGNLGAVYAGRFIAGIGVGETVVVGPVYLAEIAPASIRGLCTCIFTGCVYLGIMLAYFANWGSSLHISAESYNRWAVPSSLHIMFAGLILLLSFFQIESPRYLVQRGRDEKALAILANLRGLPADHPYCQDEFLAITSAYQAELEATHGQGLSGIIKEIFLVRSNAYRLFMLVVAQVLGGWSGGGSITLYAVDLFELLGVTGQNENLFATVVLGIVKFVASLICAFFLIDFIGRRRSLITGIILQGIAMAYVAAFLTAVPIANNDDFDATPSQTRAGTGALAFIYLSGVGWALGWNSAQYLLSAEMFAPRLRAVCASIVMVVHFGSGYGTTRAVPNMLLEHQGLTPQGTFWFFTAVTVIGGIYVFFCVPEPAGRSLETMDRLFSLPWYKIGLHGKQFADEQDEALADEAETEKVRTVIETTHRETA